MAARSKNPIQTLPDGDPRHGLTGYCKDKCRCEICYQAKKACDATYRANHRESIRKSWRDWNNPHRRTRHGLTVPQKMYRLDLIGWACESCGEPFDEIGRALVDHDHNCCPGDQSCGECIRGILCAPCNKALGFLRDDPAKIQALLEYIQRYPISATTRM